MVLATGSEPKSLPGLDIDGERVITSDHALVLDRVPGSVIILGGGVIGVEFASVWRSFGAEVTIVEMLPQLLPLEDETSAKLLQRAFRRRGIKFELGARFESVKHTDTGVTVTLEGGKTLDADLLLVAVGRGPVSADLGYSEAGVAIERGFVKVDALCRTNIPSVSAVGDLINTPQLAHVGFAEGIMVAERTGGLPVTPIDYDGVPRITYSDPEVASVGITSAQADRARPEDGRVQLQPRRQRPERDLADPGRGQGHRDLRGGPPRPRDRRAHRRKPRQRAHRRGPADLQLGRRARGRGPAHPPPSHPVGGDRRSASRAGRQAPARTRLGVTGVMSVSVSMPQLGESVTEGTVTRWLKKEGERVEVDEPLLEVSTDKVDTEIPSPASGILRGIAVDEDETVAVGAQLAIIDDGASGDAAPAGGRLGERRAGRGSAEPAQPEPAQPAAAQPAAQPAAAQAEQAAASSDGWSSQGSQPNYAPPAQSPSPRPRRGTRARPGPRHPPTRRRPRTVSPSRPSLTARRRPTASRPRPPTRPRRPTPPTAAAAPAAQVPTQGQPSPDESAPAAEQAQAEEYPPPTQLPSAGEAPYVTPLVRKLAAEHAVDLETVTGTGVGGRIRKQDVIEAARAQRAAQPPQPAPPAQPAAQAQAPQATQPQVTQAPQQAPATQPAPRPAVVPSSLRGTTQRMSRPRQVIAQRMVESLRVSAQLTTVVEADVTAIARLRNQARQDFEAREGVKLSFLPFFALAAVEALKVHPKLNALIDGDQVTYHDAEHLGIAVDTERGLMVPVIHSAGDLNIGGLARKISDLASRTRSGQVAPDELAGGTFTLTNTGSRGALFDTPIINQPQVAILGTGTVVKRPVVVEDPALGEVIAVRSMVYLALTYDHRLVDGADAARFLTTVKNRLEEGAFEAELGL